MEAKDIIIFDALLKRIIALENKVRSIEKLSKEISEDKGISNLPTLLDAEKEE